MSRIYNQSGGFRRLHAFNFATIVHLGTISFCKRFISWRQDPLGKTAGQMIGASRSGKQNIIEGSERAKTSSETEIKLTDVAKASLGELQGDLEEAGCRGKGDLSAEAQRRRKLFLPRNTRGIGEQAPERFGNYLWQML